MRCLVATPTLKHTAVKDPALYDVIDLPEVGPTGAVDPTSSWENVYEASYVKHGSGQRKIDLSRYVDVSLLNTALTQLSRE